MAIENYQVNIYELRSYMETDCKQSLNEYIREIKDNNNLRADLSAIKFDNNNEIDLTRANLSFTILDGLNFDGNHVIIKQADLVGASIHNTHFTNHIDLAGTKFGEIYINKSMFQKCNLADAEYEPAYKKNKIIVKVTDQQLEKYLKSDKSKSLNEYLQETMHGMYPSSCNLIADLSGRTIDVAFNDANLSGSYLTNCEFRKIIKNLTLKDCYFYNNQMKNCTLISPNLDNIDLNIKEKFIIKGGIISSLQQSKKFSRKNLEAYVNYCQESTDIVSFHEFAKLDKNIIADFSNLDLSNLDLYKAKFSNCNFAHSNLDNAIFDQAILNNCNFSSIYGGDVSLQKAMISNCNFSNGNLENLDASNAIFENVTAINLIAKNANLNDVIANNINLTNSQLEGIRARNLTANGANFSYSNCSNSDFKNAKMNFSNFHNSNLQDSILTKAKISHSRISANVTNAILKEVKINKDS